ncbi:MAG: hypothetical protein K9H25_17420 [Rhodospirillum sp.]|nr:hypothetical protein [Rhodospirillum sp.]MCF8490781.1 hypothetical protein [Rhodospirillum sp.]MCF8499842.1 hypothetical protein [Rhodospirillum sp.]
MYIVVIPAKGQSGRLSNKNMRSLLGRPMLDYTIDAASRWPGVEPGTIYVSTDSDDIAAHAEARGIGVIRRAPSLGGETPIIEVYRHAWARLGHPPVRALIGLQPDHPDRRLTISETITAFEADGADMLVSTEADGTKNGAHYIVSLPVLKGAEPRSKTVLVDDCTNVHHVEDLEKAEAWLAKRPRIVSGVGLDDAPLAAEILGTVGLLRCAGSDRGALLKAVQPAGAYLASAAVRVDAEFLDAAPNLRLIGSPHTGRDHLDLDEIALRNITLFHIAEDYDLLNGFTATAEHAFGLLLALTRRTVPASRDAAEGVWSREKFTGFQLFGKTLGIIGLGRLGTMVARMAQGFGMRVLACDIRNVSVPGVEMASLDRVLRRADVLSLHIHLDKTTEGLIDARALARMKPGAILINTSRGRVIDETALLAALRDEHLGGAALDVVDGEWLSPEALRDHPLLSFARKSDRLLITPHIGGATQESISGARDFMARRMADWLLKWHWSREQEYAESFRGPSEKE